MTTKRSHTITITDDDYTVTLSSAPFNVRHFNLVASVPNVLMHNPDYDYARPVRAIDKARTVTITLDYYNSSDTEWETPIAGLYRLKRMIDGANSQALRYWVDGDVKPVYLDILPYNSGAEMTARSEIIFGHVDDSGAYYDEAATHSYIARTVTITLIITEYSYATTYGTVTLSNALTGSPGMTEYSGTSPTQLAYGITRTGAGAVCTIDTTNWCVGGRSQKVVCAADGDGIDFPQVVMTGADHRAFVWIYPVSGTVRFQFYDVTGTAVTQYEDISPANTSQATRTYLDHNGKTWYRLPLTESTWTSGNTGRLQLRANGGAATFLVDAAYLEIGATSGPEYGWMSAMAIDNRNDHTSTNTSYINYIDVWDIPGDAPALCRVRAALALGGDVYTQIIGAFADGRYSVGDVTHWVEEDDSDITTVYTAGSGWTSQADAGRSGGSYQRYGAHTGPSNGGLAWLVTGTEALALCKHDMRVFILARTDATGISNTNKLYTSVNGVVQGSGFTFTTAATWELIDCGIIRTAGLLPETLPGTAGVNITFGIETTAGASSTDIDAIMLIPLTDEFVISGEVISNGGTLWIDGYQDTIITDGPTYDNYSSPNYLGRFREIRPDVANRIIIALKRAGNAHVLTDAATISIDIKRRSRHLLGGV